MRHSGEWTVAALHARVFDHAPRVRESCSSANHARVCTTVNRVVLVRRGYARY